MRCGDAGPAVAVSRRMKFIHAMVAAALCTSTLGACLDDSETGDESESQCIPILTCDPSSTDESESSDSEDPEDDTWECVPFLTC